MSNRRTLTQGAIPAAIHQGQRGIFRHRFAARLRLRIERRIARVALGDACHGFQNQAGFIRA